MSILYIYILITKFLLIIAQIKMFKNNKQKQTIYNIVAMFTYSIIQAI